MKWIWKDCSPPFCAQALTNLEITTSRLTVVPHKDIGYVHNETLTEQAAVSLYFIHSHVIDQSTCIHTQIQDLSENLSFWNQNLYRHDRIEFSSRSFQNQRINIYVRICNPTMCTVHALLDNILKSSEFKAPSSAAHSAHKLKSSSLTSQKAKLSMTTISTRGKLKQW